VRVRGAAKATAAPPTAAEQELARQRGGDLVRVRARARARARARVRVRVIG